MSERHWAEEYFRHYSSFDTYREDVESCSHFLQAGHAPAFPGAFKMKRYEYIIDGSLIENKKDFYDQIIALMTDDPDFEAGRNLDALADILRGGFGKHPYGAGINVIWKSFDDSVSALGESYTLKILKVMLKKDSGYDCRLSVED